MTKLSYLDDYFTRLCTQYKIEPSEKLKNDFSFNSSEKGTLYARYQLLKFRNTLNK